MDQDAWGRPCRLVLGKLRHRAPPITETLDPATLEQVFANLFPPDEQERAVIYPDDDPLPPITEEKMADAMGKMESRNVAPGSDEIPGRALALQLRVLYNKVNNKKKIQQER